MQSMVVPTDHYSRRLLLISNSTLYGSDYLDHCSDMIVSFLGVDVTRILFVPYASHDTASYTSKARNRFAMLGVAVDGLNEATDAKAAVQSAQAMFIGGGNTFLLLKRLQEAGVMDTIRSRVRYGMPYIGTSAGSNVACRTINTTNDMPIVTPASFDALRLVSFNYNAHYLDADVNSKHKGETREQRLTEFHHVSDIPVIGVREGSALRIEGYQCTLTGLNPARVFLAGHEPYDVAVGADLSFILDDLRSVEETLDKRASENQFIHFMSDKLVNAKRNIGDKVEEIKESETWDQTTSTMQQWSNSASDMLKSKIGDIRASHTYNNISEKASVAGLAIAETSMMASNVIAEKTAVAVESVRTVIQDTFIDKPNDATSSEQQQPLSAQHL